jgi:hypothetical protein
MALSRSLLRVFSGEIHLAGVMVQTGDEPSGPEGSVDSKHSVSSDHPDALGAVGLTNSYIARTMATRTCSPLSSSAF